MDPARVIKNLLQKRQGRLEVLGAVLVIVAAAAIGLNPHAITPQFTATPACANSQVNIYGGSYQDGKATLDIRNPGTAYLQLRVYALSENRDVHTLPNTVYLTPGGQGEFSFDLAQKPAVMEVHDTECFEAVNLWKF